MTNETNADLESDFDELQSRSEIETFRGGDLRGRDLSTYDKLLPDQLAGADLTGATLPEGISLSDNLGQIEEISKNARTIFVGLILGCVYSWLTIGTTTDVQLLVNTASSPLPIIGTNIPIAWFYLVGAAVLAAVYCYLHFYLQRLWRALAAAPSVFPDGRALDDKAYPWLLTSLVRMHAKILKDEARPLVRLENGLSTFLAWWLVPLTLFFYWVRFLPRHDWLGTGWLVILITFTTLFGLHSFRLAKLELAGELNASVGDNSGVEHRSLRPWMLRDASELRPDGKTIWLLLLLSVFSISAIGDPPRAAPAWVAWSLNSIGIRTYADLNEATVAQLPNVWTGKEVDLVKRVSLKGQNLKFAEAVSAVLVRADLRIANLEGAVLSWANLEDANLTGANLEDANLTRANLEGAHLAGANLEGAVLSNAKLQGADLRGTNLQGANLQGADLQGANLRHADLQGAVLGDERILSAAPSELKYSGISRRYLEFKRATLGTNLEGADLSWANLQGANLTGANLRGAVLPYANLQGAALPYANLQGAALSRAKLQGADLRRTNLQGADLHRASLWRALLGDDVERDALWDHADLRGANGEITDDIDGLIAKTVEGITDEETREAVAEKLEAALRGLARPDLPSWQARPNVMFNPNDKIPQAFDDWGQSNWTDATEYEEELATLLAGWVCHEGSSKELAAGLAGRLWLDSQLAWLDGGQSVLAQRLAARMISDDQDACPPVAELPDSTHEQLKELAAQLSEKKAAGEPKSAPTYPARAP